MLYTSCKEYSKLIGIWYHLIARISFLESALLWKRNDLLGTVTKGIGSKLTSAKLPVYELVILGYKDTIHYTLPREKRT